MELISNVCAGFLESLWRDIDMNRLHHNPSDDLNLVIVSHGLASRVFLMKWFKWTVEQFEDLNNLGNAEFRVMQLGRGGDYSLSIHHSKEEMAGWGLSSEMIADQQFRAQACRGCWNDKCSWYYDSFFDNLVRETAGDLGENKAEIRLEEVLEFRPDEEDLEDEEEPGDEEEPRETKPNEEIPQTPTAESIQNIWNRLKQFSLSMTKRENP